MIVSKNQVAVRAKPGALDIGAGFARLVMQKRDGSSIVVSLRHRTNLVGSADGCRVRLRSADIAPLHAVITRDPTGLQVRRLDPDGRLELNREPIDVSYLRDGDKIRVGPISMQLSTNVEPLESTTLLEGFAQHIKTRLSMDRSDYAQMLDSDPTDKARDVDSTPPKPNTEKESETVHRWQQLSEQLEQQERLLSQVDEQLNTGDRSSDPKVHDQVHELSQLHDRIRNEISLLRMWLRPKEAEAAVVETSAAAKKETPTTKTVHESRPARKRSKVVMNDQNTRAPGTVIVDDFTCDECCGVIFNRRKLKWYELPIWLLTYRGVECTKCEHQTIHRASKIKTLE